MLSALLFLCVPAAFLFSGDEEQEEDDSDAARDPDMEVQGMEHGNLLDPEEDDVLGPADPDAPSDPEEDDALTPEDPEIPSVPDLLDDEDTVIGPADPDNPSVPDLLPDTGEVLEPVDPELPSVPGLDDIETVLTPADPEIAERPFCGLQTGDDMDKDDVQVLELDGFRPGLDRVELNFDAEEGAPPPSVAVSPALSGDGMIVTMDGETIAHLTGIEKISAEDIVMRAR